MSAKEPILELAEICSRQLERGLITTVEYVGKLFNYLAADKSDPVLFARHVAALVPPQAKESFRDHVMTVLQPTYRYPVPRGFTQTVEEELRESAALTFRVRSWAANFRYFL